MELLIPGLLLVALMVWASTKIKKHAADAFEPEFIESENYSLQKPDGFLHVLGNEEHEFFAYSKEYGKGDASGIRQATIEIDIFHGDDLNSVRNRVRETALKSELTNKTTTSCEVNTDESANEIAVSGFYKIVASAGAVYRLRFAMLPEHVEEYLRKKDETFDSFTIKTK
jgi:hypothetical protein